MLDSDLLFAFPTDLGFSVSLLCRSTLSQGELLIRPVQCAERHASFS